jgi:Fe-Mn family superoxide dismutase
MLVAAGGLAALPYVKLDLTGLSTQQTGAAPKNDPFQLPELPYPPDALEAAIDRQTMEIHHGRHHAGYVSKLNDAIRDQPEWRDRPIDEILRRLDEVPEAIREAVRNNGGGHYNHSLFWKIMSPQGGGEPAGALGEALNSTFTDFETFKTRFREAALARFGSGWSWLVLGDGKLQITHTPNQDCPLSAGQTPLLGLDVWEHAYYLRYQNKRADYADAWWQVVNWNAVSERFDQARRAR